MPFALLLKRLQNESCESETILWKLDFFLKHSALQPYWALTRNCLFWYALLKSMFLNVWKAAEAELFSQLFNTIRTSLPNPLWNQTCLLKHLLSLLHSSVSEQTQLSSEPCALITANVYQTPHRRGKDEQHIHGTRATKILIATLSLN